MAAQSAIEYALLVAKAGGASQPAEPLGAALDNALNNLALDAGEATGAPEAASAGHAGEPVHPEPVEEISDMKAEADLAAPQEISPADEEPEDTVENAGSSESVLAGQVGEDE
ncbi:MAG TPA: hypothetical protein VGW38_15485 [Chloroflexota bacterium]|nr:hypothetical protein [Chloroflexota bacterium]